ncbi:MAG: 4-hydroxy-tetrahydrodipicolinate synthase [Ruminococcaceae bacterium]|nr:4-hydroxy-tetrahydrodipicolinate synthase [Oscillospiraceae bacterium]
MILKGSFTALVTPFTNDDKIDFGTLGKMVQFQIENGADGLVVLGTTGETPTLTEREKEKIVRLVISEVNGKIPVIVGVCSNNTKESVKLAQKWENMGANAVLVIAPYYNKANEIGMEDHFTAIADSVNIPTILYNIPSRTGCPIPIKVLRKLSRHPNIIGIKEASGDMNYLMKCAKLTSDSFALLSGNDDMVIPTLSVGGTGVISVISNLIPNEWSAMVHDYLCGYHKKALETHMKYLDLIETLFIEPNPIPIKTAMNIADFRLPLCKMLPCNEAILRHRMKEVGLC